MELISVTNQGQVTIPQEIRQRLGIRHGSLLEFALVGEHRELHVRNTSQSPLPSGFGMLKSSRPAVPADFDPASLLDQ
jgi:AbrB family looped-hinge helix DNA binding protein